MLFAHAGWFFFPLIPLIWFSLIALFFVFVVRRRRGWCGERESGEALLAQRYARGEIAADEYRSRRDVLREGRR